jgi:hypothetical protein
MNAPLRSGSSFPTPTTFVLIAGPNWRPLLARSGMTTHHAKNGESDIRCVCESSQRRAGVSCKLQRLHARRAFSLDGKRMRMQPCEF